MKQKGESKMRSTLTLLSGVAIGAVVTAVMGYGYAQTSRGVYFVSEIDISDPAAYAANYAPRAIELIKKYNGRLLAVGGASKSSASAGNQIHTLGDDPPVPATRRITITHYDSLDQLKELRSDSEYQSLRKKATDSGWAQFRSFAVDAAAN